MWLYIIHFFDLKGTRVRVLGKDEVFLIMRSLPYPLIDRVRPDLPLELCEKILRNTDPMTCLVFGRFDLVDTKALGIDKLQKIYAGVIVHGWLEALQILFRDTPIQLSTRPGYMTRHGLEDVKFHSISHCDLAAKHGHLRIMKWLLENQHWKDSTKRAMDYAAANGHLDVVTWLHDCTAAGDHGCTHLAMTCAAENGHVKVLSFLHKNRTEGCGPMALAQAAANGHLEVVRFFQENRFRYQQCFRAIPIYWAAASGRLDVVKYLCEEGHGEVKLARDVAARNGNLDVVRYLNGLDVQSVSGEASEWYVQRDPSRYDSFLVSYKLIGKPNDLRAFVMYLQTYGNGFTGVTLSDGTYKVDVFYEKSPTPTDVRYMVDIVNAYRDPPYHRSMLPGSSAALGFDWIPTKWPVFLSTGRQLVSTLIHPPLGKADFGCAVESVTWGIEFELLDEAADPNRCDLFLSNITNPASKTLTPVQAYRVNSNPPLTRVRRQVTFEFDDFAFLNPSNLWGLEASHVSGIRIRAVGQHIQYTRIGIDTGRIMFGQMADNVRADTHVVPFEELFRYPVVRHPEFYQPPISISPRTDLILLPPPWSDISGPSNGKHEILFFNE